MTFIEPTEHSTLPVPIKTDLSGRLRLSEGHKTELLDAYDNSGLSGVQFARLHGLKYPTFISWVRKRKDLKQLKPKPTQFMEVDFTADTNPQPLCVALPNGARIEVHTTSQIALAAELFKRLNV